MPFKTYTEMYASIASFHINEGDPWAAVSCAPESAQPMNPKPVPTCHQGGILPGAAYAPKDFGTVFVFYCQDLTSLSAK